jgi:hypothetical protein
MVLDMVEGNIATVYTTGVFDADDPDRNPGILKQLAKRNGGEAYFPASASQMASVCRGIAEDIRARYTIGYLPRESNGTGTRRHIRVFVKYPGHPKLTVRTRATYRYEELAYPTNKLELPRGLAKFCC